MNAVEIATIASPIVALLVGRGSDLYDLVGIVVMVYPAHGLVEHFMR